MSTATQTAPATVTAFRDFFVDRLEKEFAPTTKVIENIKDGDWKPDAKARTARDLAWHIVSSDIWFLDSIAKQNFDMETATPPPTPATMHEIVEFYRAHYPQKIAAIKTLTADQLSKVVDFFGMKLQNYEYLNFAQVHTIHHRGQLATYLRPLGGKCPDIYGGSADVPWEG